MRTNREFHSNVQLGRSRFYLADFHVHSPASFDVRLKGRLERLPTSIRAIIEQIPESLTDNPVEYEKEVARRVPPDLFLEELAAQRDRIIGDSDPAFRSEWAVVAITDHNVCSYACSLAEKAMRPDVRSKLRLIVLPGIELDVIYRCPGTNDDSQIHMLCSFAASVTEHEIRHALRDAIAQTWQPGKPTRVTELPAFVQKLRHGEFPAICIAAHVSSSKGVQKETKRTILSHIDAELSRLGGERNSGKNPDIKSIDAQTASLINKRSPEDIALRVLDLIGSCGFDALQVSSTGDSVHYRRLHRFRDGHGRAVPIVASDAHSATEVFQAGDYFPHLKLPTIQKESEPIEFFDQLRAALRYGETRFSATKNSETQYWISGLQIIKDSAESSFFWPLTHEPINKEESGLFTLPLSRNLNTLVGGRGSGKSATIEAISFLAKPMEFTDESKKREVDRAEFYKRAQATLSGCQIRLCYQFAGGSIAKDLPKRAVIAQRYFDPQHKHKGVDYSDCDGKQLVPQQIPAFRVQIFRLGEIEKQAETDRLRLLFDQICGPRIEDLNRRIDSLRSDLQNQRAQQVKLGQLIQSRTKDGTTLRKYIERKILFDSVNTDSLMAAYKKIDDLEETESLAIELGTKWKTTIPIDDLGLIKARVSNFFAEAYSRTLDEEKSVKPHLERIAYMTNGGSPNTPSPTQQRCLVLIDNIIEAAERLAAEFVSVQQQVAESLKEERSQLSLQGLPSGSKDREAKRSAFAESEDALREYRALLKDWRTGLDVRRRLRSNLLELVSERSKLRRQTADFITKSLARDLDEKTIRIEADAQPGTDRRAFEDWLTASFKGANIRFQEERILAILETPRISPDNLRSSLLSETDETLIFLVERENAAKGGIDSDNARRLYERCCAVQALTFKEDRDRIGTKAWLELPDEFRDGLIVIVGDASVEKLDRALQLDEVVFDDTPVIRLNDRPDDPNSIARPIGELSPGQRCSAVLPILLLTGDCPLVIDQPEDNLDNRLIRQVIVNILASIKLRRQVIIATHNPNLPVLGDVESAIVLQGIGDRQCKLVEQGDLDSPDLSHHLTEVMEGGREAFQYRHTIYSTHWDGAVERRQQSS